MKRFVTLGMVVAALCVAALPAFAGDVVRPVPEMKILEREAQLTARVRAMMSGVEYTPRAIDWQRLPAGKAAEVLMALYASKDAPGFVRARCVAAIGYFPGARTTQFLTALALGEGNTPVSHRRTAVKALVLADQRAALQLLPRLIADNDVFVREATVLAYTRVNALEVLDAFETATRTEQQQFLRERLDTAIMKLRAEPNLPRLLEARPARTPSRP